MQTGHVKLACAAIFPRALVRKRAKKNPREQQKKSGGDEVSNQIRREIFKIT